VKDPEYAINPYRVQRLDATLALLSETADDPVRPVDPKLAEGFVRLTSLILLKSREQKLRTLGVVSPHQGDGATTAALNLAICLAQTLGRPGTVLLVDGDTHGRTLSRLLNHPVAETSPEATHPLIRETQFNRVSLMTAPPRTDRLGLHDPFLWETTLEALTERFAFVIVDCPAVLGSPEGLVLPACVDELVLVVRAGKTPREAVGAAVEALKKTPLGVVLNGGEAGE
jgi:Mrp family chromosome partitioning ATPase